jgi:hypothetical protein
MCRVSSSVRRFFTLWSKPSVPVFFFLNQNCLNSSSTFIFSKAKFWFQLQVHKNFHKNKTNPTSKDGKTNKLANKLDEPLDTPKNMALKVSQIHKWRWNQRELASAKNPRIGGYIEKCNKTFRQNNGENPKYHL